MSEIGINPAAKKGILKQLAKNGGAVHIKELHEFSTLRFATGHQAFSQLMEGLVADDLVMYDGAIFHLTEAGTEATKNMLL